MGARNLTSAAVGRLPFTKAGQAFYTDAELAGFGVRVGKSSKVFYAEARVAGRTVRTTIGRYGALTAEQGRKRARELLGRMAGGEDPNATKRVEKARSVTFREAFEEFIKARRNLAATTRYGYERFLGIHNDGEPKKADRREKAVYIRDWLDRAMAGIGRDEVLDRHALIGKASPAQANQCFRFVRALYNFAIERYLDEKKKPVLTDNPVKVLSKARAWFKLKRRRTHVKAQDLAGWFKAVQALRDEQTVQRTEGGTFAAGGRALNSAADVAADWLEFTLLYGLRKNESLTLAKSAVDLRARTFIVSETKNDEPHELPLTHYAQALIERRMAASPNEWVFHGDGGARHLIEPKKQIAKVIKASGVDFTPHDLRRTFETIAESLDTPAYALKRLLNHKTGGDVTAGYIIASTERLRKPLEAIHAFMLKTGGVKPSAEVVTLKRRGRRA